MNGEWSHEFGCSPVWRELFYVQEEGSCVWEECSCVCVWGGSGPMRVRVACVHTSSCSILVVRTRVHMV